jgi:hypothetical protein
MNRIPWVAGTLAVAACLSACSLSPWSRKKTASPPSPTLTRMGDAAYRIDLEGLEKTSRQGVITDLLKSAAAVTLEAGYDYFIVSGGGVRAENELQATPFAVIESTARLSQRYSGSVLFQVFRGEMPKDNPLAFDARLWPGKRQEGGRIPAAHRPGER